MIQISKFEAEVLRENGRAEDVHMSSKTHKGKAKRYYATENPKTIDIITAYRKERVVYERRRPAV